jgi:mRNA-degrading endonuclease RelE of RelBE toxin-antitoxin system
MEERKTDTFSIRIKPTVLKKIKKLCRDRRISQSVLIEGLVKRAHIR